MFQSSPAPWDGRYLIDRLFAGELLVSILARPVGRALRSIVTPTPMELQVSILARPVGRALREGLLPTPYKGAVSILAHPVGRALRV